MIDPIEAEANIPSRRALVVVNLDVLTGFFTPAHYWSRCSAGLPADVEVIEVILDRERHELTIIVEHDSFAEVPSGQSPPILWVTHQTREP